MEQFRYQPENFESKVNHSESESQRNDFDDLIDKVVGGKEVDPHGHSLSYRREDDRIKAEKLKDAIKTSLLENGSTVISLSEADQGNLTPYIREYLDLQIDPKEVVENFKDYLKLVNKIN